jgi:flagellar hook-length control protein FliK
MAVSTMPGTNPAAATPAPVPAAAPASATPAQPLAASKQADPLASKKTSSDAKPSTHTHRAADTAHPAAVAADVAAADPLPQAQPITDASAVIPLAAAAPQPGAAATVPQGDITTDTTIPAASAVLLQGATETATASAARPMQAATPGDPAIPAPAKSAAALPAMPLAVAESAPASIAPASIAPASIATASIAPAAAPSRADTPVAAGSPAGQVAPVLVQVAHAAAGHQITLRLNPDELGQVTIRIDRAADGTASVQVMAERPETLKLLQADQPQLHRALDNAGLPPDGRSLNLSLATSDSGGHSGGSGSNPGGNARQDNPTSQSTALPRGLGPTEPGVPPGWQRAGIDITA